MSLIQLLFLSLLFTLVQLDPHEPIIGIDLGTTYSSVGIYNEVIIIPNEFGHRITPSIVAFTDGEKLVGEAALNQAHDNPKRTISVVNRLMAKKFNDPQVQ